jgi:predicted dehydrogenase
MKIGILGLGSIGSRHAKNLKAMGHDVLGYDPARGTHSRDAVLEADAIIIASPTTKHCSDLLDCYQTPTLVEKPIVLDETELRALSKLDLSLVKVGYNLRFHNVTQHVKKWLDKKLIGDVIWANFVLSQYSDKDAYHRDGVLTNWLSHEVDLAIYLLGPAALSFSEARVSKLGEDMAEISLHHKSGARSMLHADYFGCPEERRFVIIGTVGKIIGDLATRRAKIFNRQNFMVEHCYGGSFDEDYIAEMKDFLAFVENKPSIGCSGKEGMAVLNLCLDAREFKWEQK